MRTTIAFLLLFGFGAGAPADDQVKRIVVIGGKKSHGPEGNGIHDYNWSAKLIKVALENSNVRDRVDVTIHTDGWPADTSSLERADTIMIISDGRDGDVGEEALHIASPENIAFISRQIERGCGLVTFHFSTFAPDRYADQILDWVGGYFDWETDGKKAWYSAIQVVDDQVQLATSEHAVSRGVRPTKLREEFYFNLRFHPLKNSVTPIWTVPALPGRDDAGRVVAWARERPAGGRGFGTTCGHFYDNWRNDDFRKLILNALVWTAKGEVPAGGVESAYPTRPQISAALEAQPKASLDLQPIKVLLLTGNEAHKWHNWEKSTPAIKAALEKDPRVQVEVALDIERLAQGLDDIQSVVLNNYCNWHDPRGLSQKAKENLLLYLKRGGGLVAIHFANGAFHFSLPEAGASDWPEYRRIVRRVWNHQGTGDNQSGHDAFGRFRVRPTDAKSPLIAGLAAFDIDDELYFRQEGQEAIEPLLVAHSKVTDRDEPLAWTSAYGDGRVFQILLGHSEKTYEAFEAREILRRSTAWTARRQIHPMSAEDDPRISAPVAAVPEKGPPLIDGRFQKALDARVACAQLRFERAGEELPFTFDCWVRLFSKSGFNIIAAHEPKTSKRHWEIFTEAGNGRIAVYAPGRSPDHARTELDVVDGQWHHVAMTLESEQVRVFVDGRRVADVVTSPGPPSDAQKNSQVFLGRLVEGGIGCDGWIDHARLSSGYREIGAEFREAATLDDVTRGLWRFDEMKEGQHPNDVSGAPSARLIDPSASVPADSAERDHYGKDALGFRWREEDSADNRWNETEVGPFLSSSLFLPDLPPVAKGLTIRVGEKGEGAVCYDSATGALRAAWTGGFLQFDPTRHGLISPPRFAGKLAYAGPPGTPIHGADVHYRGLIHHGNRVVLRYQVGPTTFDESPWLEKSSVGDLFTRTMEVGPSPTPIRWPIARGTHALHIDGATAFMKKDGVAHAWTFVGQGTWETSADGQELIAVLPGGTELRRVKVCAWSGSENHLATFQAAARSRPAPAPLAPLLSPGPRLWTKVIETATTIGDESGPWAVDTFTIPFDNPYRALVFISGHDFLPTGELAVATVHGDVWLVNEIASNRATWSRFATGLFQPLGLRVIDGVIHVLGRDQITRLVDTNRDGQADFYQNFHNAYETSTGGHDYVACLENDEEGNFYLVHATQGLVRISKDGCSSSIIATGFRNPNGLGVGPGPVITVAPQEGEWTPSSAIVEARDGGHYGYKGPKIALDRPLGYNPPLCWIPRRMDNSGGGQVWVPTGQWGALSGALLHFSYGQCRMMLVLRVQQDNIVQGGIVTLPLEFRSGVMRGRFSPHDGHLYVSGLKGWVSSAVDDGGLYRVRATGKPFDMPISFRTYANGIAVTFSDPLDKSAAENADHFDIQQWNYRYSAEYGSADYSVRTPGRVGRDDLSIASATLLDERTVFLEVSDLKPAMQTSLSYRLKSQEGRALSNTLALTLHRLGAERIPEARLARRVEEENSPPPQSKLSSGVRITLRQGEQVDILRARTFAWAVPQDAAPTAFLKPGPFTADIDGWVKVAWGSSYRLSFDGIGKAQLCVNLGPPVSLDASAPIDFSLRKGLNHLQLSYESPPTGPAHFRLLWSGELFDTEPIPPGLCWHESADSDQKLSDDRRRGRELVQSRRCAACHAFENSEPPTEGPRLANVGDRLHESWMARWIHSPRSIRPDAHMPSFFADSLEGKQASADIAAYLTSLKSNAGPHTRPPGDPEAGLALFEDLGCLGCHRTNPEESVNPHGRITLRVSDKFHEGWLDVFLLSPERHYQATRMPNFQLQANEAAHLVKYLKSLEKPTDASTSGSIERGRELFQSTGCSSCHQVQTDAPLTSISRRPLDGPLREVGCVAAVAQMRGPAPDFGFSDSDRQAIRAYWTDRPAPHAPSPADESMVLMRQMRCHACHPMDGEPAVLSAVWDDESERGTPPEWLPDLTWAGEKLHSSWTNRLFSGKLAKKTRPWLKARMPTFRSAELLAEGLACQHGHLPVKNKAWQVNSDLAAIGSQLISLKSGLDCRQCHAVGDEQALGDERTNLSPGINFVDVKDRLRTEHYRRFVLDPPRFDISTRMPRLVEPSGKTKITSVLDGDAKRQFEAIWHYIQSLPEH